MRPPMQAAAPLQQQQQHEINIQQQQQHHQQQQQQLQQQQYHHHPQHEYQQHQQQQSLSLTTAATTTPASLTNPQQQQQQQQRKAKFLGQRKILLENQSSNFGCPPVPTTATKPLVGAAAVTAKRLSDPVATFALTVQSNNIHTYQQQQQQQHHQQQQQQKSHSKQSRFKYQPYEDSIQLVDLSCSPVAHNSLSAAYHELPRSTATAIESRTRSNSLISDCAYSRSSSSEDGSYVGERYYYQSPRSQIIDDPAEHFIINFPAADSPTHGRNEDLATHLPLSETEPLLRNVEGTITTPQRSICLTKNNGSLIFTRKDLSQQQQQQENRNSQRNRRNSSVISNNNFVNTHHKRSSVGNIGATALQASQPAAAERRHQQRSHKSGDGRKQKQQAQTSSYTPQQPQQQQHNQQHRRSLQLNYNNNLIASNIGNGGSAASACGYGNNNYFCAPTGLTNKSSYNRGNSNTATPTNTTPPTTTTTTGITAAVTRKQHAYSWYAPVYSALEEELEQDSRDSSPIHNLANTKKHHLHHYQHRSVQNSTGPDNETDALLEARNQINIQAQLHPPQTLVKTQGKSSNSQSALRRSSLAVQAPSSLPLPPNGTNNFVLNAGGELTNGLAVTNGSYDGIEGPQAGSLGLAGGPLPRLKRWENFIKSFFIRPSHNGRGGGIETILPTTGGTSTTTTNNIVAVDGDGSPVTAKLHMPPSPEIRIIRTPSEQNMVILRDPAERCARPAAASDSKVANGLLQGSSTSSLNVVQQKLWKKLWREGSAASLYQEKSNSIVQYRGMRKCETVLALTRQSSSVCSPVLGMGPGIIGGAGTPHMGSGIFSATGIEQIRPLNRLRNSVSTMNATCSRCSSLLSLAASGSRYSLNVGANGTPAGYVSSMPNGMPMSQQQQQQHQKQQLTPSNLSSSNISSYKRSRSRCDVIDGPPIGQSCTAKRYSSNSAQGSRKSSGASSSNSPPSIMTTATFTPSTSTPTSPTKPLPNNDCRTSVSNDGVILSGFPPPATAAYNNKNSTGTGNQAITVTSLLSMSNCSSFEEDGKDNVEALVQQQQQKDVAAAGVKIAVTSSSSSTSSSTSSSPSSSTSSLTSSTSLKTKRKQHRTHEQQQQQQQQLPAHASQLPQAPSAPSAPSASSASAPASSQPAPGSFTPTKPFEVFTCKMCLVDVESADEATTLAQCGCRFCTECMKAYIEFEISEGAYEISCPDPQCPAQSIVTLAEIANLTTTNLMKKHHRYRLNREIELDKSRTWCPRAGCETVCLVGPGAHTDSAPSTSAAHNAAAAVTVKDGETLTQLLCAVQCPSCKDEFCSACKKTWHPNISCEENSRRLVADGQDDIGIPFDNDLIKCCPMCAVPIEKDEGCAQMMCKRCKHVFCWYCLASLDDDFLLRHYDKGPCKNKLGHSRASVVWHRAQVIGIFAGFGILLLVASPLLLLAAPCIICCKCRICSGSKVDEGDAGELDEATALQS